MKLGIISAMPEEVQSLLDGLEQVTIIEKGMRSYFSGLFRGHELVVVFSRWGKVAAAVTTTQLLNDFKVDEIIFTGVSGSLDTSLKVGDIVIGTKLYQHDMDTRPLFNRFEIPLLGKTSFSTNKNNALEKAVERFKKSITTYIAPEKLTQFSIDTISIKKGIILSGDQFISSKEKVAELKQAIPNALCVEMEGASVAQVCYEYNIPFSIIRVISDNANDDAPIDFPAFTKAVASKYAKGIIENYIDTI
jgi:adenosylhomocysteine nucleosidase